MPPAAISWRERLGYWFENLLSNKSRLPLLPVIVACCICALLTALLAGLFADRDLTGATLPFGLVVMTWRGVLEAMGASGGWTLPILLAVVTIAVLLTAAALTGTLTLALHARAPAHAPRTRVIEVGHTLVLGWSSKIQSLIESLSHSAMLQANPRIVILADQDPQQMEDAIKWTLSPQISQNVVYRRGNPLDAGDLTRVSPQSARSIVVLAPDDDLSDGRVFQWVLALTGHPALRDGSCHVVAEVRQRSNFDAALLVGGEHTTFAPAEELLARIVAQSCREPGISVVYRALLDRAQASVVLADEPSLIGRSYREALLRHGPTSVFGIMHAGGETLLNPPMRTRITPGDRIVAIATDSRAGATTVAGRIKPDRSAILMPARSAAAAERTLLVGWNARAANIVRELDLCGAAGSQLVVLSDDPAARQVLQALAVTLQRQVRLCSGDGTDRSTLESLRPADFNQVIVLSRPGPPASQTADSATIMTLLHLRGIADASGKPLPLIAEIADTHNPALARIARLDDLIPTTRMTSLLIARLAEDRHLAPVLAGLSAAGRPMLHVRPITQYLRINSVVDFYTLIESAALRGETAIGYRRSALAEAHERDHGVVLNPDRAERMRFTSQDQLIVVADQ